MSTLSWVQVGAEVAVYSDRPGATLRLTRTTITKVNKLTFRLDGDDRLYKNDTGTEAAAGYYGYRVIPVGTDEFYALEVKALKEGLRSDVEETYERWRRNQTDYRAATNLLEAVTAMQASL